jgi:hypothetical protein
LYATDIAFSSVRGQSSAAYDNDLTKDKTIPGKVNMRTSRQFRRKPVPGLKNLLKFPVTTVEISQNSLAVIFAIPERGKKTWFQARAAAADGRRDRAGRAVRGWNPCGIPRNRMRDFCPVSRSAAFV